MKNQKNGSRNQLLFKKMAHNYRVLFIAVIMSLLYSCKTAKIDEGASVNSWEMGTSIGKIDKITKERIDNLSALGFKYIEVVLTKPKTDQDFDNITSLSETLKGTI